MATFKQLLALSRSVRNAAADIDSVRNYMEAHAKTASYVYGATHLPRFIEEDREKLRKTIEDLRVIESVIAAIADATPAEATA